MNAHPNSNTSQDLPTSSIGSFRAASQRMHNAVMAEFGSSLVDGNEAEASMEEGDPGVPAGTTENGIDVEEFQPQPQDAEITDA